MIDEGRLRPVLAHRTPGATVALGQQLDLGPYRDQIAQGLRPRHVLVDLADGTGGTAVSAHGASPGWRDRLGGLVVGGATDWWVAGRALADATPGGYIHANGEAIGFALLARQRLSRRRSARIGFWVMTPDGRRVRWWLRLIRALRLRPLLVAESEVKRRAIRRQVGPRARLILLDAPIDLGFFSPAPREASAAVPLVASAGLEQRDYRTLAEAIAGLDIEVVICAVSPDAASTSAAMPDQVPDTMRFEGLSMAELRDLYRRADLVVVPTLANTFDAGTTTVMEAMACGRPVIASDQGLFSQWADQDLLRATEVGSAESLRAAIVELLADDVTAARLSRAARAEAEANHNPREWLRRLLAAVRDGGVPVADHVDPRRVPVAVESPDGLA